MISLQAQFVSDWFNPISVRLPAIPISVRGGQYRPSPNISQSIRPISKIQSATDSPAAELFFWKKIQSATDSPAAELYFFKKNQNFEI